MLSRRGFLGSLLAAPVVITTPGLLMPVKKMIKPTVTELMTFQRYAGYEIIYALSEPNTLFDWATEEQRAVKIDHSPSPYWHNAARLAS